MASTTKKRVRRAAKRIGRQRRAAHAAPPVQDRGRSEDGPPFPEEPGGAGVREPRRPTPLAPAGGLELKVSPEQQELDLSAYCR